MFSHCWQWFVPLLVYFLAKKTQAAGCLFFVIMGKLERTQMPRQQNNSWQCSVKDVKPRPSRAPENWRSRREIFAKSNPSASPRRNWMKAGFRFVPRNAKHEAEWNQGWSIREAFVVSGNGIKTERDGVSIHFSRKEIQTAVNDFRLLADYELRQKYNLENDSRDWSVDRAKADTNANKDSKLFKQILYRPFDVRHTWFSGKSKGFIGTPASALMHHFIAGENVGFITTRQTKEDFGVLASSLIAGHKSCAAYDINTVFPLYLYANGESEAQAELVPHENGRRPYLAAEFVSQFAETVGFRFISDGRGDLKT